MFVNFEFGSTHQVDSIFWLKFPVHKAVGVVENSIIYVCSFGTSMLLGKLIVLLLWKFQRNVVHCKCIPVGNVGYRIALYLHLWFLCDDV